MNLRFHVPTADALRSLMVQAGVSTVLELRRWSAEPRPRNSCRYRPRFSHLSNHASARNSGIYRGGEVGLHAALRRTKTLLRGDPLLPAADARWRSEGHEAARSSARTQVWLPLGSPPPAGEQHHRPWAHSDGVPAKVIAQIMRHTKVDPTMNVYTQVLDGAARAAADRVGSELFRIVQNREGSTAPTD